MNSIKITLIIIILLNVLNLNSNIVYVKKSATGSNNGTSWINAYNELYTAVNSSAANDTLYVAAGTYMPNGTNSISTSIVFNKSLILMGGFPNTGSPNLSNRNFKTNQTIISGQLTPSIVSKNLLSFQGFYPYIEINGFVIEKGSFSDSLISCKNSIGNTKILNCIFRSFYGSSGASGAFQSIISNYGNLEIENCFILNLILGTPSFLKLNASSNTKVMNSIFYKNQSDTFIKVYDGANLSLINCNLVGNSSYQTYDTFAIIKLKNFGNVDVKNCIFNKNIVYPFSYDSNQVRAIKEFNIDNTSFLSINNSVFDYTDFGTTNFYTSHPLFINDNLIFGNDNLPFTADDGLNLKFPCAFGINGGTNIGVTSTIDILGNARIYNSTIDIGPYEAQIFKGNKFTAYVNPFAIGSNNGTSWANAYTNLNDGINACSDTIKLAAGTYYNSLSIYSAYNLRNNLVILGGYPNTGNPTNLQRNPTLYKSIISGLNLSKTKHQPTCFLGESLDSTLVIDGINIENYSAGSIANYNFGGFFNRFSDGAFVLIKCNYPRIQNCEFKNNRNGFCIYDSTKLSLKNFLFYNNGDYFNNTGPLYNQNCITIYNSNLEIMDCIFKDSLQNYGDSSILFGKGLMGFNADIVVKNCIFENKRGGYYHQGSGAAICLYDGSKLNINNSKFYGNRSRNKGACLYLDSSFAIIDTSLFKSNFINSIYTRKSTLVVMKSIFDVNIAEHPYYFTELLADDSSEVLFDKCLVKNPLSDNSTSINNSKFNFENSIFYNDGNASINVFSKITKSKLNMLNSTFYYKKQSSTPFLDWICDSINEIHLYNSILWNKSNIDTASNCNFYFIKNSLLQNYIPINGNIINKSPKFINQDNLIGEDNLYFTEDDGLNLFPCSEAVNSGNNLLSSMISNDIKDQPRTYNLNVDMGAYEYCLPYNSNNKTGHVNSNVTVSGNGNSWSTPYKYLTKAFLNLCLDTIKIAEGKYNFADNPKPVFLIEQPLIVLGSYKNSLNPIESERNVDIYPTVIDTQTNNIPLGFITNLFNIKLKSGTVLLDGLMFNNQKKYSGSIHQLDTNNLIVSNCRFYNSTYGYNITNEGKISIYKSVFNYNERNIYNVGQQMIIDKCIFNNSINNNIITGTPFSVRNSVFAFSGKQLNTSPGAIFLASGSDGSSIINCTFINNYKMANPYCDASHVNSNIAYYNTNNFFSNTVFRNNLIDYMQYPSTTCKRSITNNFCSPLIQLAANCMDSYFFNYVNDNKYIDTTVFLNCLNPIGKDSLWFTADDGFNLKNCKFINTANNSYASTKDIKDTSRILFGIVDHGAYEFEGLTSKIKFIDTIYCPGDTVSFTASIIGGYSTPTIEWQKNGIAVAGNVLNFKTNSFTISDSFRIKVTYIDTCMSPSISYSPYYKIKTINTSLTSVSINMSLNPSCLDQTVTFNSTLSNFGTINLFNWKKNSISVASTQPFSSSILSNNDTIQLLITSSLSCIVSPVLSNKLIINRIDTSRPTSSIYSPNQTLCKGSSGVLKTNFSNAGTNPTFKWYKNNNLILGQTDSILYFTNIQKTDTFYSIIKSSNYCSKDSICISNKFVFNILTPDTPKIIINTIKSTFCPGDSIQFNSIINFGGLNPKYQWFKNNNSISGAIGDFLKTNSFINLDTLSCMLTSDKSCIYDSIVFSNKIIITALPKYTPNISISNTPFCIGKTDTFNSTIINGGLSPTYKWFKNGSQISTTPVLFTSSILPLDTIYCILKTSFTCVTDTQAISNKIILQAVLKDTPSINISHNGYCVGSTVVFNSIRKNTGSQPVYKWYKNRIQIAGANDTSYTNSSLIIGDTIYSEMLSSLPCISDSIVKSNKIIIAITGAVIPSISIAKSKDSFCSGDTVIFSSSTINAGTIPVFSWYKNGLQILGANNSSYITNTILKTDTIMCKLLSNHSCASPNISWSNKINLFVTTTQMPSIVLTSSKNSICIGTPITFYTTSNFGGTLPVYQWRLNNSNIIFSGTTYTSFSLNNNDTVSVKLTSNIICATPKTVSSNNIVIKVSPTTTPIISISGNTILTTSPQIKSISSTTSTGLNPTYQWQDSNSSHTWLNITGAVNSNISYNAFFGNKLRCMVESKDSCANPKTATSNVLKFSLTSSIAPTNEKFDILIYPNPSSDEINISNLKTEDNWTNAFITDIIGKKVIDNIDLKNKSEATTTLKTLSSGVYFINLVSGANQKISYKIIKE